jgi:hypothetical protein
MRSLVDSLEELEKDLSFHPPRIAAHSDMPYAIFVYPPADEFTLRKHLRLFSIKLSQNYGRRVTFISIARLVWDLLKASGLGDLYETELLRGFAAAERHIHQLITSPDFKLITDSVLEKISSLSPETDVVFMVRAGGFAPNICRTSWLLEGLHNRTSVPIILFYPGRAESGTDLRFFDLPTQSSLGAYNYRVKLYGVIS